MHCTVLNCSWESESVRGFELGKLSHSSPQGTSIAFVQLKCSQLWFERARVVLHC